jgi:hypothetical protein
MKKIFGIFVALLLFAQIGAAQKGEKLEKKWLALDVEMLKAIPKILPPEAQTKETLAQVLGGKGFEQQVEFEAKLFGNGSSGGYTLLTVSVYTFRGSIVSCRISSLTSKPSWLLIKPHLIEAWNRYAQVPFQETDRGIFYEYVNEAVLREYKDSINREIGAMKQLEIPAELKDAFDYLTAPFNNVQVSNSLCGYGATKVEGRKMIELFINAGRVDLIENILKGFNHGGRVYAAIALLEMKKSGVKLSDETEQTIEKVVNLKISVMTCAGCFGFSMTAKELLLEYNLL